MLLEPKSAEEVADAVRAHPRVLAIGSQTKPRLSAVEEDVTLISTRGLTGITEYDPGEFTFTALAGTPIGEIVNALAAEGQYLPFDPMLAQAGATLGGTVAAGINGPGRFRYGGIRDFILAVQFIEGTGQLLRGGAKVVKNAAGFDFPKFFVGSLGRFGILTELTFKVFPRPSSWLTLCAPTMKSDLAARLSDACRGRWEIDALEYDCHESLLYARIGGPAEANDALANELAALWLNAFIVAPERSREWWADATELSWAARAEVLLKVPVKLADLPTLWTLPSPCRARISGAGSSAWIAMPSADYPATCEILAAAGLSALTVRGSDVPLFTPAPHISETQRAVQKVFDPAGKFAPFAPAIAPAS
jgi:glycolate oxidase FAD binding subunit